MLVLQCGLLMELNNVQHRLWNPANSSWVPMPSLEDPGTPSVAAALVWRVAVCEGACFVCVCVCGGGGVVSLGFPVGRVCTQMCLVE